MIADYLLADERVARVEAQIRSEFPRLPEGCEFVTFVAEEEKEQNGVLRLVRAAIFAIKVPNPRRPILPKMHRASWPLEVFREMEEFRSRLVDYPDPALVAFRSIAPQAINWYETMASFTDPVEGDWSGETGVLHGAD